MVCPIFRGWIKNHYPKPEILVEPFAGGGIISLTALFEEFVSRVVMVRIDEDIAAAWQSVVDRRTAWYSDAPHPYEKYSHATVQELVIGKNLSWMNHYPSMHHPIAKYQVAGKKREIPTTASSGRKSRPLKSDVNL